MDASSPGGFGLFDLLGLSIGTVITLIIVDLLLSYLVARIAKNKGYGASGFFIFSFFLFLPALIVVLCLRDLNEPVETVPSAKVEEVPTKELADLWQLKEQGCISEEEFEAAKKRTLERLSKV